MRAALERFPLAPLYITVACTTGTMGAANAVLPLFVLSLGGTAADWGLLYALFALAMAAGEATMGTLSDRLGSRLLLTFSRAASAILVLCLALLPGLGIIALLQFLRGGADAAIWPLGKSHISRSVSLRSKGMFLGLFGMMAGLGSACGSLVGGFALEWWGFAWAFLLAGLFSLVAAGSAWWACTQRGSASVVPRPASQPGNVAAGPGRLLASGNLGSYGGVAALSVLIVAGWAAALATLPVVASTAVGLGPAEIGVLASSFGFTTTLLSLPLGSVSDRFGRQGAIMAGLAAMALSMLGFAWGGTFWALLGAIVLAGIGWGLSSPAKAALVTELVSRERQGTALGWFGACEDIGLVLGGGVAGLLLTVAGRETTFLVFGLLLAAAIALCPVAVRGRRAAHPATAD